MVTRTLVAKGEATYADGKRRASTSITINGTSWADLDTGLDITLPAAAGDKIEVGVNFTYGNEAVVAFLDCATIVGGSPVTYFSSGSGTPATDGLCGWTGLSGAFVATSGGALLTLGAGDVSGGTVTLRLRVKTASATNRTVFATSGDPFLWFAKNLGNG